MYKQGSQYNKMEKADILEMTVAHLRSQHHRHHSSVSSSPLPPDDLTSSRYITGYRECAVEVANYLASSSSSSSLRQSPSSDTAADLFRHLDSCLRTRMLRDDVTVFQSDNYWSSSSSSPCISSTSPHPSSTTTTTTTTTAATAVSDIEERLESSSLSSRVEWYSRGGATRQRCDSGVYSCSGSSSPTGSTNSSLLSPDLVTSFPASSDGSLVTAASNNAAVIVDDNTRTSCEPVWRPW